ncbi:hypothetical protein IB60_17210 [Brucella abortus LMN1]|nr:hypothetical protein IB60_17210 [Brucella abortus LMN1]
MPRELQVRTAPIEVARPDPRPSLPDPRPVQQREVTWRVLTPDDLPDGPGWVFFGLTPDEYEDLALNQAELLRFITEAKWRLRYYRGELPPGATPPDAN